VIRRIFSTGWAQLWPSRPVIKKQQKVEPIVEVTDKQEHHGGEWVQAYDKDGKVIYVRGHSHSWGSY
jgi:hypothetical protein